MAGRARQWITTLRNNQALIPGVGIEFDLAADLTAGNRKGATIQRTLLELWVRNDTVNSVHHVDFGRCDWFMWIDADAAAAGGFPDPNNETEQADWLMRGRMMVVTEAINLLTPLNHRMYDLRSQRICRAENDQLMLILQTSALAGGGIFVSFLSRVLLLKP